MIRRGAQCAQYVLQDGQNFAEPLIEHDQHADRANGHNCPLPTAHGCVPTHQAAHTKYPKNQVQKSQGHTRLVGRRPMATTRSA